eukprot:8072838-Pyramimonas_sp.AAC.1
MRAAARLTRDAIIRHKPHDPMTRLIILRTISRAVWQQNIPLARRVMHTHPLGIKFIALSCDGDRVELKGPPAIQLATEQEHCRLFESAKEIANRRLQAAVSGPSKAKLRQRIRGLHKRGRPWAPFGRKLCLQGIRASTDSEKPAATSP